MTSSESSRKQNARPPLLEVCVGSLADARAAQRAGADRIELCSALELGGLTPSAGLIEQVAREIELPLVVMIRPRAGGFAYNQGEFATMLRDAKLAIDAGVAGIVFGVLDDNAEVDSRRVGQLVSAVQGRESVFHRAFDFVRDQSIALEILIEQGVTRVLTSGGALTAEQGIESLQKLIQQSAGRIEILPAGGIRPENAARLIEQTGCNQIHVGAATSFCDFSISRESSVSLCDMQRLAQGENRIVEEQVVAQVVQRLATRGE
jgi:copper homeostasis protein